MHKMTIVHNQAYASDLTTQLKKWSNPAGGHPSR